MDGTKFILRIPGYQQRADFSSFCDQTLEDFLARKPPIKSADALLDNLSAAIQNFRHDELTRKTLGAPMFGKKVDREHQFVKTKLMQRYEEIAALILHRMFPDGHKTQDMSYQFFFQPVGEKDRIQLCRLRRINGEVILDNPGNAENSKRLWRHVCSAFDIAIDTTKRTSYRRDKALEFYCLLCHYMPFQAGSAMASHLALEYLLRRMGLQMPHVRSGIDLNLAACTRTPEDFISVIGEGFYFDGSTTPLEIIAWQNKEIECQQQKIPYREFHTVDDVAKTAVELHLGRPVTTFKKMILQRMLDAKAGAPHIETRRNENGCYQVRFIGYDFDYLGLEAANVVEAPRVKAGDWLGQNLNKDNDSRWLRRTAPKPPFPSSRTS